MVQHSQDAVDAIVLRTLRYGESDVIAQLLARDTGRRGVIAKGARKPKSRLGARLEPYLVVRLTLYEGRGDLAIVRGVEVLAAHERLRMDFGLQQVGAAALDLLGRLATEGAPAPDTYHLAMRMLALLDADPPPSPDVRPALLAAFQLKLLHASGLAPHLSSCVRCGDEVALTAFDPGDGGVVCVSCGQPGDRALTPEAWTAAVALMREPLATVVAGATAAGEVSARLARAVHDVIVAPTAERHAGARAKWV